MKVLLISLVYVILLSFGYGALSAAPWVPTRKKERDRLIAELPLVEGKVMVELGCGDANVLFAAADRMPGLRAIGYDVAILPIVAAWLRKLFGGRKYRNISIRIRDLFSQDLSQADIIFVFLLPKIYDRLGKKFGLELKDDCTVAVEAWNIPGIEPMRTVKEPGMLPLYFYEGRQFRTVPVSPTPKG